jgi:UDPglucose 6-dehydrogenase
VRQQRGEPVTAAQNQPTRVAIVGAGVVGLATGTGLAAVGADVQFFDADARRVTELRGRGLDARAAADLPDARPDLYLISVPTPTVAGRAFLGTVRDACSGVAESLRGRDDWACVVVRSTVPPGTTDDLVRPLLEAGSGKSLGSGFGLAMNPEFLREASALADFVHPRVIVIGAADATSEAAVRGLYEPWPDVPVFVMPPRTAEATKYVANLFNATKISFFNELHRVLSTLEADSSIAAQAVALGAEGLWNPTYGTKGGAPFGGACLPKDLEAFLAVADELGVDVPLLRAVQEVNASLAPPKPRCPETVQPEGVAAP